MSDGLGVNQTTGALAGGARVRGGGLHCQRHWNDNDQNFPCMPQAG